MKILYVALMILLLHNEGCRSQNDDMLIEGNIKNLPNGKVYLTEAHQWNIFLDSTTTLDGNFTFRIKADSNFIPFMASIYYSDSSSPSGKSPILINAGSSLISDNVPLSFETAFYLERGITKLSGDVKSKGKVNIVAGKETELMYQFHGEFGYLGQKDTTSEKIQISAYKKFIRQYPYSYFFLQGIANNKEQYTKNEMTEILQLFDKNLQRSTPGRKIKSYINQVVEDGEAYPNVFLLNFANELDQIIDTSAKVNMLVFWASWCGPCRKEIPQLILLNNEFENKGLKITSISIDKDISKWKEAVENEKMTWLQLRADLLMVEKLKAIFRFSAIPTLVFTDSKGYKIASFTGYDSFNIDKYKSLIESYTY